MLTRTSQVAVQSSVTVQVNADGGANYDRQLVQGVGGVATAAETLAGTVWTLTTYGDSAQAGAATATVLFVPSYRATTFHKTAIGFTGQVEDTTAEGNARVQALRWRSTGAMTRLAITAGSGNLLAGSRLAIYGLG